MYVYMYVFKHVLINTMIELKPLSSFFKYNTYIYYPHIYIHSHTDLNALKILSDGNECTRFIVKKSNSKGE